MKTIITFFVSTFFTLAAFAQYNQTQNGVPVVTLSFTANGNRAYQVTIDGANYYSDNSTNNNNNGNYNNNNNNGNYNNGNNNNGNNNSNNNTITINNLQVGQHNLQVFRLRNNAGNNTGNNSNSQSIYTNTFNLRQGYDMAINIKNGQVQFTETATRRNRRGYGDNDNNGRNRNNGYTNPGYNQTPMADNQFSQLLQSVRSKFLQPSKITAERDIFNSTTNYFTSSQITQLLQLINAENNRLELAKLSYRNVTDPANFTQLNNLFTNLSYRNDLEVYVKTNWGNNSGGSNGDYNNGGYNSNRTPMQDADFSQLLQKANNHFLPRDKVNDVRNDFNNTGYYFNTSQIRQLLSVVTGESDRFELAKLSYRTVTDASNFLQLTDLFVNLSYRNDLENYVKSYRR